MKKVTLEIDDKYATILSVTVVGRNNGTTDVTTCVIDITKCDHITVDKNAHWLGKQKGWC